MRSILILLGCLPCVHATSGNWIRIPAIPEASSHLLRSYPEGILAHHRPLDPTCRERGRSEWTPCVLPSLDPDSIVVSDGHSMSSLEWGKETILAPDLNGKPRKILALADTIEPILNAMCTGFRVFDLPGIQFGGWGCNNGKSRFYKASDSLVGTDSSIRVWRRIPEWDLAGRTIASGDVYRFGNNLFVPYLDTATLQIHADDGDIRSLPYGAAVIVGSHDTIVLLGASEGKITSSIDGGRTWGRRSHVLKNMWNIHLVGGVLWGDFGPNDVSKKEIWRSDDLGISWKRSSPYWGSLAFDGALFLLSTDSGLFESELGSHTWKKLPDTLLTGEVRSMESFQEGFVVRQTGLMRWKDGAWRSVLPSAISFAVFQGTILAVSNQKVLRFDGSKWDSIWSSEGLPVVPKVACQEPWGCVVTNYSQLKFSRDGSSWILMDLPEGFHDNAAPFGFTDSGRLILHSLGGYQVNPKPYNLKLVDSQWVQTNETPSRKFFDASGNRIAYAGSETLAWTDSTVTIGKRTLQAGDLPGRIVSAAWLTVGDLPHAASKLEDTSLVVMDAAGKLWALGNEEPSSVARHSQPAHPPRVVGGFLVARLDAPSIVQVESFEVNGRRHTLLPSTLERTGEIHVPLPRNASLGFLRITVDGRTTTITVAPRLGGR